MSKPSRLSIHKAHEPRTIVAIHSRGAGPDRVTIGFYTHESAQRIPVNASAWESAEVVSRYAIDAGLPLEKVTIQRGRGSLDIWMP